jgi:hypothetical protein
LSTKVKERRSGAEEIDVDKAIYMISNTKKNPNVSKLSFYALLLLKNLFM